ncbi:hypothetical protein VPH35_067602 [Triticum aestivum]
MWIVFFKSPTKEFEVVSAENLDVNECAQSPGSCHGSATCHNTVGGFHCSCPFVTSFAKETNSCANRFISQELSRAQSVARPHSPTHLSQSKRSSLPLPGESRSFFYLIQDDLFMIKTARKSEVEASFRRWTVLLYFEIETGERQAAAAEQGKE